MGTLIRIFYIAVFAVLLGASHAGAACIVSPASISFGTYSEVNLVAQDALAVLNITCTPNTKVTISLGPSFNSGSIASREMRTGGGLGPLLYNLFSDKRRNTIFGEGADSITVRSNKSVTVYGRIPAGQKVPAGSYSDTLVITVTP